MFEVDLGKIKFKWKGTYSNGASYSVDDVVRFGDSAYVAIAPSLNEPPVTFPAKWELMASGVTGMLTSRGDILYRDATGANRLPKGTHRSSLVMRDNDPVWKPQGIIQCRYAKLTDIRDVVFSSANTWYDIPTVQPVITPQFQDSILKGELSLHWGQNANWSYHVMFRVVRSVAGGAFQVVDPNLYSGATDSGNNKRAHFGHYTYTSNAGSIAYQGVQENFTFIDTSFVAGQSVQYKIQAATDYSGTSIGINYNGYAINQPYTRMGSSTFIISEINNGD